MYSVKELLTKIKWLPGGAAKNLAPEDLLIHASGVEFTAARDRLDYLWFEVTEREAGREYHNFRIVRLLHVKFLPVEVHSEAGLLQKMRSVLRGASGAGVNLVYAAAGIFQDPPLGIVQCYGVATVQADRQVAVEQSARDLATLEAGLKGQYRQIRLEPLTARVGSWLYDALENMPHALVAVGHPDPHETTRLNKAFQNPLVGSEPVAQSLSFQQNEILYRGMAALGEEFLLMVLAYNVSPREITRMLAGYAEEAAIWASQQTGMRSASFGISLPAMLSGALAESASRNSSYGTGEAVAEGASHTVGVADSQGVAESVGHASSRGWSHSVSKGVTVTDGNTVGHTTGTSASESVTDTVSEMSGSSHTEGRSSSVGGGNSHSESSGWNVGGNSKLGDLPLVGGIAKAFGMGNVNVSAGYNSGVADTNMSSWSTGEMSSDSSMSSSGSSHAVGASRGTSQSNSSAQSHSVAVSESENWGTSGSETDSWSKTNSSSLTNSRSDTTSQAKTHSSGESSGVGIGRSFGNGLSVGLAPSFSIGNSAQWQNDPAMLVTDILRTQEKLLKAASIEGGYYTDVYALARTPRGKQTLMGLIPASFQGTEEVVTGVQCRDLAGEEAAYIRQHAQAWTPSTRQETIPGVLSGYMDSTLLTLLQLATYTAPGVFEEGAALTTQEETPKFAFYPEMDGQVLLGRQYSVERGDLTQAGLRLSSDRHFHTAFVGDTGFGKTVAAERLAFETTHKWHYRTIVLDFGQGWRKALSWQGLEGRVDIRQLFPGARRPMRWNFLQVPRRIEASRYRTMICELFANAGRMGARQLGFMRRAISEIYALAGVLTDQVEGLDENLLARWRQVQPNEAQVVGRPAGTPLASLQPDQAQRLAVHRSQAVSVVDWISTLRRYLAGLGKGDQASRTSLEGVLLRLELFAENAMLNQYGPGDDTLAVEDLGLLDPGQTGQPWGITVIEGGAEMDDFAKSALFSLLATVLYADAVVRRRESLAGAHFPPLQIFFEEANKVLSGVASGAASEAENKGLSVSSIWESMWRDGRKYSVFLHPLAQTVSQLPPGILASCANIFVFQTKNGEDRDIILPHLARSEKGLVNTEFKRYLARIPRTYAIAKLGYSMDVNDLEPVLIRPALMEGNEPSDDRILRVLKPWDDLPVLET